MITGHVLGRHLLLPVVLRLPNQPDLGIDFVIDTGFTGFLTLPVAAVSAMKLPFLHSISADLADDSTQDYDVYAGTILWDSLERVVRVIAMGKRPLLGTALLADHELFAQFREHGLVTVDDL